MQIGLTIRSKGMSFALSSSSRTYVIQKYKYGMLVHFLMLKRAKDAWLQRREAPPRNALQCHGCLKRQSTRASSLAASRKREASLSCFGAKHFVRRTATS